MLTGYYKKKLQKKALQKKACEKYLSKEERNKKRQYGREQCRNLPEDERQRLVEYRKNYSGMLKVNRNKSIILLMNFFYFMD